MAQSIRGVDMRWLQAFESNQIFTEQEGWTLFRLAAFAEAIGWTLLIAGIATERLIPPHNHIPVMLAGRVHGMLFFGYMIAAIGLYPTLGWSRLKGLVALAASAPPYGSLLFERLATYKKEHDDFKDFTACLVLQSIYDRTTGAHSVGDGQ